MFVSTDVMALQLLNLNMNYLSCVSKALSILNKKNTWYLLKSTQMYVNLGLI